jgi:hypothetical protein
MAQNHHQAFEENKTEKVDEQKVRAEPQLATAKRIIITMAPFKP